MCHSASYIMQMISLSINTCFQILLIFSQYIMLLYTCNWIEVNKLTIVYTKIIVYEIPHWWRGSISNSRSKQIRLLVDAHCMIKDSLISDLSHDVTSGSDITPCNKIDNPQVVYRFSNVT